MAAEQFAGGASASPMGSLLDTGSANQFKESLTNISTAVKGIGSSFTSMTSTAQSALDNLSGTLDQILTKAQKVAGLGSSGLAGASSAVGGTQGNAINNGGQSQSPDLTDLNRSMSSPNVTQSQTGGAPNGGNAGGGNIGGNGVLGGNTFGGQNGGSGAGGGGGGGGGGGPNLGGFSTGRAGIGLAVAGSAALLRGGGSLAQQGMSWSQLEAMNAPGIGGGVGPQALAKTGAYSKQFTGWGGDISDLSNAMQSLQGGFVGPVGSPQYTNALSNAGIVSAFGQTRGLGSTMTGAASSLQNIVGTRQGRAFMSSVGLPGADPNASLTQIAGSTLRTMEQRNNIKPGSLNSQQLASSPGLQSTMNTLQQYGQMDPQTTAALKQLLITDPSLAANPNQKVTAQGLGIQNNPVYKSLSASQTTASAGQTASLSAANTQANIQMTTANIYKDASKDFSQGVQKFVGSILGAGGALGGGAGGLLGPLTNLLMYLKINKIGKMGKTGSGAEDTPGSGGSGDASKPIDAKTKPSDASGVESSAKPSPVEGAGGAQATGDSLAIYAGMATGNALYNATGGKKYDTDKGKGLITKYMGTWGTSKGITKHLGHAWKDVTDFFGGGAAGPSSGGNGAGAPANAGTPAGGPGAATNQNPASQTASGSTIVTDAEKLLGVPYVYGGTSPSGFDCSGFTQYVYSEVGIKLPRTSEQQFSVGTTINDIGSAQPGDLVFFEGNPPGHVGIYIGGGKFINAPHTGANVEIDAVSGFGQLTGIKRVTGGNGGVGGQNNNAGQNNTKTVTSTSGNLAPNPGEGNATSEASTLAGATLPTFTPGIGPSAPGGNNSGAGGATASDSTVNVGNTSGINSYQSWASAFLSAAGLPTSQQNIASIVAWEQKEATWQTDTSSHNPLNTAQPEPGSKGLSGNPDGVQTYSDWATGLKANVTALENGKYNDIIAGLKAGGGLSSGNYPGLMTWSGGGYSSLDRGSQFIDSSQLAELHPGEMVVRAGSAAAMRMNQMSNPNGNAVHITISPNAIKIGAMTAQSQPDIDSLAEKIGQTMAKKSGDLSVTLD